MPAQPQSTEVLQKELADRVRHYEGKLATLTVINGALQQENEDLRAELENAREPTSQTEEDLQELQEEFAKRIAVADRTIAGLKEKVESLKTQAAAASQGGTVSNARLQERESYIASLQAEGEGLSRKNGELEATVRKLRAAASKYDQERERQQSRMSALESQLAQEQERNAYASQALAHQVDDLEAELRGVRHQWAEDIAAVRQEAAHATADAQAQLAQSNDAASQIQADKEAALSAELHDQRAAFQDAETRWLQREDTLRREVAVLEERLRDLELEKGDLMAASSDSTRPLIKQIEAMVASASAQQASHVDIERKLVQKLRDAEMASSQASERAHAGAARAATAESALRAAQSAAAQSAAIAAELTQQLQAERRHLGTAQAGLAAAGERAESSRQQYAEEKTKLEGQLRDLQEQLWESEEKNRSLLAERPRQASRTNLQADGLHFTGHQRKSSALSLAADDVPLPISRSCSHVLDSPLEPQPPASISGRSMSGEHDGDRSRHGDEFDGLLRVLSSKATSFIGQNGRSENARITAMERRLSIAESAAESARAEALQASERAESLQLVSERHEALQAASQAQEDKYRMALELLGERNERIDQLEDDIQDMKHIFHSQLSSLVDQLAATHVKESG